MKSYLSIINKTSGKQVSDKQMQQQQNICGIF